MTATAEHLILDNIVKKALDSNNDDLTFDPTRPGSNGIDKNNGNCPLTTNKHLANHCNDAVCEPTVLGKPGQEPVKLNGDIDENNENTDAAEGATSPKEVSCGKCAQKFTSLQRYMEHSCTTMPLILSNHVDGDVEPFSGDDSSEISDIENFEGDIVYNPDGSAFLVDSSSKNSNQGPKDGQNASQTAKDNVPTVFPGIVNSLHIPAYMTGLPFGMGMQGPYTTPIVHSFRVYDVRSGQSGTKGDASDQDGKTGKLELEQRGSGEGSNHAHGKPILMCFLCKLSFGFTKSFIAHASNEHKMTLNDEEKKIMATKSQSAIIQGLGKEKNPLISFLEPNGTAKPQNSTSLANLQPPNNLLHSSSPTSVSYMLPASSSVSTNSSQSTGHITTSQASPFTQGNTHLTSSQTSSGKSIANMDMNSTARQSILSNSTEHTTAERNPLPTKSEADKGKGPSDKVSIDQKEPKSSIHRTEIFPLDHRPYLQDSRSALKMETKDSERLAKEGSALIDGIEARIQHALNQDSGHDDPDDRSPPSSVADDNHVKMERNTSSASPFMDEKSRGTPASISSQDMMHEAVCSSHGPIDPHHRHSSSVECPKCDMVLGSSRSLGGHMTMMHSRNSCKTLKCPKCNWHYKYQQTLEAHMKEKHPENETKCVYCETNQPHPRLSRGETYTCGYKPYRCEVCNYSTTTKGNLSIHMQSDKHLNNVQELQNGGDHMFLQTKLPHSHHHSHPNHPHHPQDNAANKSKPKHTWRCDVCDYETNVARNLRIHMTSEKHIHNMMAIQQNVSQMQQEMQTNLANYQAEEPMYMYLAQNMLPMMAAGAATTPESMEMSMMAQYGQYDPVTYAALMENMAMGMNAPPEPPEQPTGPDDPAFNEPLKLYQCSVCNKFSTDDLEALQDHVHHRDRSQPNEQLWRLVLGDVQQCALCNYTTQVKANFQLHMKTDKHQQKLQLFNHIREGGKQNEWRLKYMNVGNPIQVRCNACDYYTYSVDKLQAHAHPGNYRHETSMKLFRHLQKINITVNSETRRFRCPLCNYATKAKLNLIQHVQSLQHIKNEERMLLKRSAPPEAPSTSADPASGEGALDLSKKDKASPPIRDSPDVKSEAGDVPIKKNRVIEPPNAASRVKLESRSPNTTQIFTCPYCKYSSIDQQRITAHVMSQHSIKPQPILRCPLCQEVCTNKINLEVHLMDTHSVSRDCIQGLMVNLDTNQNPEFAILPGAIPGGVTAAASQLQASAAAVPPTYISSNPAMEALAQAGLKSPDSALEAASTAALQSAEAINLDAADRARDSPSDIDSDLYRCQKCHQNFANIDQLYAHQNKVCPLTEQDTPGGPGFLCWKKGCNQYFKSAPALQMHFKEIHAKRQQTSVSDRHLYKFRCNQCSLAFKTDDKLQNHMQYHLLRAATKCPICQRSFRSISGLENHIETNHQGFSKTELLQLYNPVQNGDIPGIAPFAASKDEASSETPEIDGSEADSQMSAEGSRDDKDDNTSSIDDDGMDDASHSEIPIPDEASYMDPNNKYKCHRCRIGFVKQTDLSSHNKSLQHRKGEKSSQAFSLQKYWDPNRPYKCDVCKESFTQKNILLVHYNSVSHLHKLKQSLSEASEQESSRSDTGDDKPYKCTLCKVSYSQAATLDTHMRSVLHQSRAAKQETSSSSAAVAVKEEEREREKGATEQSIINTIIENGLAGNPTSAQQLLSQAMQAQEAQVAQYQQLQLQQLQQLQLQQLQQAHLQHHSQVQQAQAYLQQQATSGQMDLNQALQMELALAQLAGFPTHMMYPNHMSTAPPNVFACNQCASVFVSQEALTHHQQTSCGATKAEAQAQAAAAQREQERSRLASQQESEQPPQSESPPTPVSPSSIQKPMLQEGSKRIKKSHIQRKLLEGYGFDLVQQYNESRQGLSATIAAVDKIPCQHCRRQFSSIFVYKAHLEEIHKKILPNDEVEKYSKKFMDDLIEAAANDVTASLSGEEKETTDDNEQEEMEQEKAELEEELLEQERNKEKEKEKEHEKKEEEKEEPPVPPKSETPVSTVSTEDSASTTSAAQLTASQILQQAQHGCTPATSSSSQSMPPPPSPQMFMANPFPFAMMQTPGYPNVPVPMQTSTVASQSPTATANIPAMQAVQYIDPNYMQKSTKRARTRISDDQLKILRAYFDINNSPTEEQIAEMSDKSGLPHKVIKHWFRNTLFKERQRNKDSPYNFNNPPTTSLLDTKKESSSGRPSPSPSLSDEKDFPKDFQKDFSKEFPKEFQKDFTKDFAKEFTKDFAPRPAPTIAAAAASAAAAAAAAAAQAATKDPIQKIKNEPRTPSSTPPPQMKPYPHEPTRSASTPATSSPTPPPMVPHLAPAETAEEIIRVAEQKAREARSRWEGKGSLGPNEVDQIVRNAERDAQKAREAWEIQNQLKRPTSMESPSFLERKAKEDRQAKDVADRIAEKLAIPRPDMSIEKKIENKLEIRNGSEPAPSTATSASTLESKNKSSIPPPICTKVSAPTTPTTSSPTTPTSASGMSDFSSPLMSPISPIPGMNTSTPTGGSSRRSGRTRFTDYQIKVLQEFFENNAYPKDDDLDHLSRLLNLSPRVIVVWFQNARQKARKIFENQPLRESELDSTGNTRYKRTPGLNYQCNKCLLVFQRFYELIRHQKQHCFKDDESLQQSTSQISPPLRIGSESSQGSSTRPASESSTSSKEERPLKSETDAKAEKPGGRRDDPVVHYQCEQCSLVFPHFKQWQEHQQIHMMSMGLFGSYMSPQQMPSPYNMMYMPYETMNGMTQEQYLQYMKAATGQVPESSPSKSRTVSEASDDTAISASENSDNQDANKDKRLRTTISPAQLDILYAKYQEDSNPTRRMLDMISKEVGLKKRVVQVWFQNTRARERKGQFRLSAPNQTRKCPFCRALFKARSALEAHIKMRHFDQQLSPAQLEAILSQPPTPGDGVFPPPSPDPFAKPMGEYGVLGRKPEELIYDDTSRDSFMDYSSFRSHRESDSPSKQRLSSEESKDSGNGSTELVRPPSLDYKLSPEKAKSPEKMRPKNGPIPEHSAPSENKSPADLPSRDKAPSRTGSTAGSDSSQHQVEANNIDDTANSISRESDMMSPSSSAMGDDTFETTLSEAGSMGPSEDSMSNADDAERRREANKRYRTQMSQVQIKVLKHCYTDYRTPTMHECELLGQEIGLPKRVIQVWFQNARAKEKKTKTTVTKHFGMIGSSSDGQPEGCKLCNVKYSMTLSVRDHVFTEVHIHNVKKHVHSTLEKEPGENGSLMLPMTAADEAKPSSQAAEIPTGASPGQQFLGDQQAQALLQQSMMNPMAAAQMQALQAMGAAHMLPPQMAAAAAGMMPTQPTTSKEGEKSGEKKEKEKKEEEMQKLAQAQQAAAMAQMSHQDAALMQYLYGGMAPYYAQMQMMYPMYAMGQEALLAYDPAMRGGQVPPHILQAYAAANPLAAAQLQGLSSAGAKPGDPSASSSPKPGSSSSSSSTKPDPRARAATKDKFIMWPNSSANRYLCRKCERVFTDRDSVTSHQLSSCFLGQVVNIEETVEKLPTNRFLCQVCPREALITEEDVYRHLQTSTHEKRALRHRSSSTSSSMNKSSRSASDKS